MWTTKNMPRQSGKVAVVTGANTGIGFEMALALFKAGAHVVIGSRDQTKALEAIKNMKAKGGDGKLDFIKLDLESLSGVAEFSADFKGKYDRLDILINNAGIMLPPASKTAEGFELQFGVNFLAHFALTGRLYPMLLKAPAARVVTLSSGAHHQITAVDFENLKMEKHYNANREYAISKLADLQFAFELQRRAFSHKDNILSMAAHPGVTKTALSRYMDSAQLADATARFGELMPAWQGALPALYAATSPEAAAGAYYGPDGPGGLKGYPGEAQFSQAAANAIAARKLWEFAEQATDIRFP